MAHRKSGGHIDRAASKFLLVGQKSGIGRAKSRLEYESRLGTMRTTTLVLSILLVFSLTAAAQKTTHKLTVKTTQGEKHTARSGVVVPSSSNPTQKTTRDLSKTEAETARLVASPGNKSGKVTNRGLPSAQAQKSDRNPPINFQYHPPKTAQVTRGARGSTGKGH